MSTRGREYSNKSVKQIIGIKMTNMVINAQNTELRALILFFYMYYYNNFK